MAAQKQDDQLERTFSSYVRIQVVVLKTYLGRWTIGRSGERGSGISVLPARYDDDDDDEVSWAVEFRVLESQRSGADRATRWNAKIFTTPPELQPNRPGQLQKSATYVIYLSGLLTFSISNQLIYFSLSLFVMTSISWEKKKKTSESRNNRLVSCRVKRAKLDPCFSLAPCRWGNITNSLSE